MLFEDGRKYVEFVLTPLPGKVSISKIVFAAFHNLETAERKLPSTSIALHGAIIDITFTENLKFEKRGIRGLIVSTENVCQYVFFSQQVFCIIM